MPTIVIDGVAHEVADGVNLLEACLRLGYDLPYFCWHPALGSVGACRQCAVKVFGEGGRAKILMACMTEAADGTNLSVADDDAVAFRKAVVEWLMRNHPHDCPVCDEGGECHLQDVTVMAGHVYRVDRFAKRTYRNQDLGPFIHHDMNRCIQCFRCVRFYRDHAGGHDLAAQGCHDAIYFGRASDGPLESPYSGNLVEVCPTGVFTDRTQRRHYTRKWDLTTAPSVCVHCGVGCNTAPGARHGIVRRIRNRHNAAVNGWFLCDRGRFGHGFLPRPDRLVVPRIRGQQVTAEEGADRLAQLAPGAIGVGSPRASLESNLALRRLVGPDRFVAGLSRRDLDVLHAAVDALRTVPSASVHDAERADAVLILGEDVENTAPRLALALRQAARAGPRARVRERLGVRDWHDAALRDAIGEETGPFCVVGPAPTSLDPLGVPVRAGPADIVRFARRVAAGEEPFARALREAEQPLIVVGTSLGSRALIEAAAAAARALGARLAFVAPECNSLGLALLCDRTLDEVDGSVAVVLEDDLYRRRPAADVDRWIDDLDELVVLDVLETRTAARATLALPSGSFAESSGTLVNSEGRAQRFFRVMPPAGAVRDAWRWLQPDWPSLDMALDALAADMPALAAARDAAPPAGWRRHGEPVPRQPHRFSGRTAMNLTHGMHDPQPPADPDAPLAFSMEGDHRPPPPSLRGFAWAPGWSSENALNVLPTGPVGVRLLEPRDPREPREPYGIGERVEADPPRAPGELLVLEAHLVFGSEPLSALAPAIAERIPPPYLEMAPEDAPGDVVVLHLGGEAVRLPVRVVPGLLPGVARLPRGLPALAPFHGIALPAVGRVEPAGEGA